MILCYFIVGEGTDSMMLIEELLEQDRKEKKIAKMQPKVLEPLREMKSEEDRQLNNKLWENLENNIVTKLETENEVNDQDLPVESDGSLYFYYIDAFEDPFNHRGKVFLFGKVTSYSSSFLF